METTTTILLSVLSTLSVVAVITIVVVSFMKLRIRVDNNNDECFRAMDSIRMDLENRIDEVTGNLSRDSDEIRRIIDSRCDRLDAKIKLYVSNKSEPVTSSETKQVLQG